MTASPADELEKGKPTPVTTSPFLTPETPPTGNGRHRQRSKKSEILLHVEWVAPLPIVALRLRGVELKLVVSQT